MLKLLHITGFKRKLAEIKKIHRESVVKVHSKTQKRDFRQRTGLLRYTIKLITRQRQSVSSSLHTAY